MKTFSNVMIIFLTIHATTTLNAAAPSEHYPLLEKYASKEILQLCITRNCKALNDTLNDVWNKKQLPDDAQRDIDALTADKTSDEKKAYQTAWHNVLTAVLHAATNDTSDATVQEIKTPGCDSQFCFSGCPTIIKP